MSKRLYTIHNRDAREIDQVIEEEIVDVTITSPPYFDLKDYGNDKQIGYGQTYEDYLFDLTVVFEKVFKVTKPTGTLWVVIDAFRKNNEMVLLPFDFAERLKTVGWKLQEVIIWAKDRTVPWAHNGQMRNLFEYVLFFSKTADYKFHIDRIREYETLKRWWVKYPERYNPRGKTPTGIWDYDIPVQGSWGKGYIRHFCPLPPELIERIITLTSDEDDVVLDPFSGSGSVMAKAKSMKRKCIGFELNKSYIKMYRHYVKETGKKNLEEYESQKGHIFKQNDFNELILNLRALKFCKVFLKEINNIENGIVNILVEPTFDIPDKQNKHKVVIYNLLIKSISKERDIIIKLSELSAKPPLSKFGIQPIFSVFHEVDDFLKQLEDKQLYVYEEKLAHKFKEIFNLEKFIIGGYNKNIISPIKVELNEKDYI